MQPLHRYLRLSAVLALGTIYMAIPSNAQAHEYNSSDPLIAGAMECTRYLPREEREHAIPSQLLAAISVTETGRWHKRLGMAVPWPWTINVEGKGYFFDTKAEAIRQVRKFMASGVKSIDVGCMQVNLLHHPKAFATLDEAFEPRFNVGYAAKFLQSNFSETGSWRKAAANYHSRVVERGNGYAGKVITNWNRIVTKIADAKNGINPTELAAAVNEQHEVAATQKPVTATTGAKAYQIADNGTVRSYRTSQQAEVSKGPKRYKANGKSLSSFQAPRMRVIEVSSADESTADIRNVENGVVVMRPAKSSKEIQTASAEDVMQPASSKETAVSGKPQPKIIHVGSADKSTKFIFKN